MQDIVQLFFIIPLLLIACKNLVSVTYLLSASMWYISLVLGYFHITTFGGVFSPFFPDEITYTTLNSIQPFSYYINFVFDNFNESYIRLLNFTVYNLSVILFFNKLERFTILDVSLKQTVLVGVCFLSSIIFTYYNYFLLKESFAAAGLLLFYYYILFGSLWSLIISIVILSVTRIDVIVLIFMSFFAYKVICLKGNFIKFIIISFSIIVILYFFSLPLSYATKLSFAARRYGESQKEYDDAAKAAASLGAIGFFTSKVYIETLYGNFTRSFSFIHNSIGYASFLVLVNITSLLFFVKRALAKKIFFPDVIYLISVVALCATHTSYRYVISIALPYIILFVVRSFNEGSSASSKQF